MTVEIERIVTHTDFDGVVSAAVCSLGLSCEKFVFAGPVSVARAEIPIGPADAVCDLPYPLECGMWFDHHPGNLEAVRLRGIDPGTIPGRFDAKPSCARVVFDHFSGAGLAMPGHLALTVAEADTIDSFAYTSVEEWRRETQGKLVDMGLKAKADSFGDQIRFLGRLVLLVRDLPLDEIARDPEVAGRIESFRSDEARMMKLIEGAVSFLPGDAAHELVVMDFSHHNRQPRIQRNLAYLLHPGALGALTINSSFAGGRKTNGLSFTLSLSMNLTGRDHGKDAGEIMRSLDLGDGHAGAAAGRVDCSSKQEMLRAKERILAEIWRMWSEMPVGGGG
ncbi:MAG: hypothetical protein PHQ19_09975 [Candidatus Krumholzibacteria bacterium]|nr:hypothetical protein [Candidatus Krumholzibacteria bacterium]